MLERPIHNTVNSKVKRTSKRAKIATICVISLFSIVLRANPSSIAGIQTAQESTVEKNNVYSVIFFEQYQPQNALDMIKRLPGFSFDGGDNNRGFGGNAGNVLIDGSRPTSKSGGLSGALSRIPAAQVDHIEIIRGGIGASEASGQSIVANVNRKNDGTTGTWAAKLRRAPDGNTEPNIEATLTTTLGQWNSAFDVDIGGNPGYRSAIIENREANGELISASDEVFENTGRWVFANGEGSTKMESGTLTINARLGADKHAQDTTRDIYKLHLPDGSPRDEYQSIVEDRRFKMAELGVDWVNNNDDWKLHLIGLGVVNDRHYENRVDYQDFVVPESYFSNFENDSLKTEYIARGTYGFTGEQKFKPEYGVEFANNRLDKDSLFLENGENTDLNGSNVVVEELRSEIFATFVYQLNSEITVEGGITGEFSRIEVSGEVQNKQDYQFLKPRLSATYKIAPSSQIVIEAVREVEQLNFNDFAASNQAQDGTIISGNPDLAPETSDQLSATYDWSFSEKGSLSINGYHQWQHEVLQQIVLPTGDNGIGNAGEATFWGVETDINLPLDGILKNSLIEINHRFRRSSYDDPISGENRPVNDRTPLFFGFKLRQDLVEQQVSWGIEYSGSFTDEFYTVDEKITFSGNNRLNAFIETSRYFGVKMQLEVRHVNTGDYTRSRTIYDGNRANEIEETEVAYRHRKPELKLSVWGTF